MNSPGQRCYNAAAVSHTTTSDQTAADDPVSERPARGGGPKPAASCPLLLDGSDPLNREGG